MLLPATHFCTPPLPDGVNPHVEDTVNRYLAATEEKDDAQTHDDMQVDITMAELTEAIQHVKSFKP